MAMKYRLNYGNGQVSGSVEGYPKARDAYRAQQAFESSTSLVIQRFVGYDNHPDGWTCKGFDCRPDLDNRGV